MRLIRCVPYAFVVMAVLLVVPPAQATFPGANGKIAFVRNGAIWTMEPDGTNEVNLGGGRNPSWSADGTRIVFDDGARTWWMYADGTGRVLADDGTAYPRPRIEPAWSPDGTQILFTNGCDNRCNSDGDPTLFKMNQDGTGVTTVGFGEAFPDWSSDGSILATVSNTQKFTDCWGSQGLGPLGGGTCQYTITGASWSPDSQRVAYSVDVWNSDYCPCPDVGLFTSRRDGTDRQSLPGGGEPAYSPDGTKIAYDGGIVNDDGTGVVPMNIYQPAWQPIPSSGPSADLLAQIQDTPDPVRASDDLHYTAFARNLVGPDTATGVTLKVTLPAGAFFVSATPSQGSCSQAGGVVTCDIGSLTNASSASVDINVQPAGVSSSTTISASATVSANESDPVPGNNSASTTTTVTFGGYARPKGANPIQASLVPAFRTCGSEATLQHGSPLSYPSCGNPQLASSTLTVGTPDANSRSANFVGSVTYSAIGETPIDPDNGDQADLGVHVTLSDVRKKADLSDYTGELRLTPGARITDHDNSPSGVAPATMQDLAFDFVIPCAGTVSTTTGSICALDTTAEAVIPGSVEERQRMVWQLGQVRVLDGGPDGLGSTNDNTLFAVQGVFVP